MTTKKLIIQIEMDNDAFQPFWSDEASRILEKLSQKLRHGMGDAFRTQKLLDYNGNSVGFAMVRDEK